MGHILYEYYWMSLIFQNQNICFEIAALITLKIVNRYTGKRVK